MNPFLLLKPKSAQTICPKSVKPPNPNIFKLFSVGLRPCGPNCLDFSGAGGRRCSFDCCIPASDNYRARMNRNRNLEISKAPLESQANERFLFLFHGSTTSKDT